jgi:hypothetical protein
LDTDKKTIVHIPNVNSRDTPGLDKYTQVDNIMHALGTWKGRDEDTCFDTVLRTDGKLLKVANLVDDNPATRDRVITALKSPAANRDRDFVDVIIALNMAKEGFDWIWCEHALTIGYKGSLTEVIQIIGRATRDAPGKPRARFTNLIAEPDASEEAVLDAVNDTLKAIAASLLMEQVLAPRFNFTPKSAGPKEGYDYGEGGYDPNGKNIGFNEATGQFHVELKGLAEPESAEGKRICQEDINEVITAFVQDTKTMAKGMFDEEVAPQDLTIMRMGKIIQEKYGENPNITDIDMEAIRQRAVAAMNLIQQAKKQLGADTGGDDILKANTALLDGVRRFAMDVRELDIDLIDSKNPFEEAYAILSKTMDEKLLRQVQEAISGRRVQLTPAEALDFARRAAKFRQEKGRLPDINSPDAWEKKLAEGRLAFARHKAAGAYDE